MYLSSVLFLSFSAYFWRINVFIFGRFSHADTSISFCHFLTPL